MKIVFNKELCSNKYISSLPLYTDPKTQKILETTSPASRIALLVFLLQ